MASRYGFGYIGPEDARPIFGPLTIILDRVRRKTFRLEEKQSCFCLLLVRAVVRFRRAWLRLEDKSEALAKWRSKWWVRLLDRLLIGKSTKDVRGVLTRRPKLIRKAGVGVAVVLVVSGIALKWVQNDLTADHVADNLTRAKSAS